jgi:hypothetical protein
MIKRDSENIKKISELCNYLIDRDFSLKKEYFFIKSIIDTLPVSFFALSIDKSLNICNQQGNLITNYSNNNIINIFGNENEFTLKCINVFSGVEIHSKVILDGVEFDCIMYPIKTAESDIKNIIIIGWHKNVK